MTTTAIEAHELTKRFGDLTAVNGIDLSIERGELFSLLGPNGAGKTTTLRMLSCLARPTAGRASVLGHDVVTDPIAVKGLIAVSPQETAISPHLNAWENLRLMARLHGLTAAEARSRSADLLEVLGLADRATERVRRFSGGMKRRLSIAMALVSDPHVLFLDEPTLGLDPQSRTGMWEHIERLKGAITIVHTTHYLEEADALATRIGIMDRGDLVALGSATELKRSIGASEPLVVEATGVGTAALAALRARFSGVRETGTGVEIDDPTATLDDVLDAVHPHGVTVTSTYRRQVSLDDVFLRLTGRQLRS